MDTMDMLPTTDLRALLRAHDAADRQIRAIDEQLQDLTLRIDRARDSEEVQKMLLMRRMVMEGVRHMYHIYRSDKWNQIQNNYILVSEVLEDEDFDESLITLETTISPIIDPVPAVTMEMTRVSNSNSDLFCDFSRDS